MPISTSPIHLRRYYLSGLIILALLAIIFYVFQARGTSQYLEVDATSAVSTDLRVHILNIDILVRRLMTETQPTETDALRTELKQELDQQVAEMNKDYQQLLGKPHSDAVHQILEQPPYTLQSELDRFFVVARQIHDEKILSESSSTYQSLVLLHSNILKGFDALGEQLHQESNIAASSQQSFQFVVFLVVLLSLAAIEIFGFRPMNRKIIRNEQLLREEISRTRAAAAAARQSETVYRMFAQHMPHTSVLMFDHELRFMLAEGPFLKQFGSQWENLTGKTVYESLPPETLEYLIPIYQRALKGEVFSFERILDEYSYQAYVTPVRDENGNITAGMILSRDTTQAKLAETALLNSESRFHSLVDVAPVGIIEYDNKGKVVFTNDYWNKIAGISREEVFGVSTIPTVHPDDRNRMTMVYHDMLLNWAPRRDIEFRFLHKDGTRVWIHKNGSPITDANGEVTGYMCVEVDITERKEMEEALLASEVRFHTLVDFAPVGIVETDARGKIILGNQRWQMLSSIAQGRDFSDNASSTIHPDDASRVVAVHQRMVTSGDNVDHLEYRFLHPDGKVVWVSDSSRPLLNADDSILGYIVTMTDITNQKSLESDLRAAEEQLRLITDNIPDIVTRTDSQLQVSFVNPSASRILGYQLNKLIGIDVKPYIHPDDRISFSKILSNALDTPEHRFVAQLRLKHAEGHYIWVEATGQLLVDEDGQVVGGVQITRDVTDRKQLQDALRTSEERLRLITDNIPDMVTQTNGELSISFINPSVTRILGYGQDELIGTRLFSYIHPDDQVGITALLETAMKTPGHRFVLESRIKNAEGQYVSAETTGQILVNGERQVVGGVQITRDITERKQLQDAMLEQAKLQTALQKEYELSNLKSRMMERITHEFRTPLSIIQSSMETLTHYFERYTPEQRQRKFTVIQNAIYRITHMLDELDIVVRGNFEQKITNHEAVNLCDLCLTVAQTLEQQLNLPSKFNIDIPADAAIMADTYTLQNALLQTMGNAARFSEPESRIQVKLRALDNGVELKIVDSGIGILVEEQARLFEPFFRGSNIGEKSGLGLGLTIARSAIEAHGGTLNIESVVGKGTTVYIWLPTDDSIERGISSPL